MKRLGVVLAGGRSTRFGSDKAQAVFEGRMLGDHALAGLAPHVDALAMAGRDWPGLARIEDAPRPGLGPLGGLAGALDYAAAHGFDVVLTCGCDTIGLTIDHVAALNPGPSVLDSLPVVGLWPSNMAPLLRDWMAATERHSVYAFATAAGARRVRVGTPPRNINRPEDLSGAV